MKSLIIIFLCLGNLSVYAATFTTTTAINSEPLDWDDPNSWAGGVVPSLNNWSAHQININHDMTRTGDLTVKTASITIDDNIKFTVDGTFFDKNNPGTYVLGSSSVWDITGDLDLSADATFQTGNGTINVAGNLDVAGHNADVTVNGVLNIGLTILMGSGSSSISGTGVLTYGAVELGGGSSIGGGCISSSDASSGGVNLSDCSVVLPVELISFTSDCIEKGVDLNWITASETDNHVFEIQKAEDSFDFVSIGEVEGHGTTSSETTYSYFDRSGGSSVVYYRLRQVDFDGEYEFSDVIVSQCEVFENDFSVFPTVSSGEYTISFNEKSKFISIRVIDNLGRELKQINFANDTHESNFNLDLTNQVPGGYIVKVIMDNDYEVVKIIKK